MSDLNTMTLAELRTLQKDVAKAIDTFEKRKKSNAITALQAAAKEHGYSLADLVEQATTAQRSPVEPKYANPENPSDTWSGRGRKPRWFIEAIEGGKTEADLLI